MKNLTKIVFYNLLVLILLIILLEAFLSVARVYYFNKPFIGIFFSAETSNPYPYKDDKCYIMRTHVFYGITHDHKNECKIKGGYADGPFIYYDNNANSQNDAVVVLGGSTSDGFYYGYSNGNTWPYLLDQKINKSGLNFKVIDAASGGHGSKQELLKLLVDISHLNENIKYIISFNGINEVSGYDDVNDFTLKHFPSYGGKLLYMMNYQKWIKQNIADKFVIGNVRILPNIYSGYRYLTSTCDTCYKKITLNDNLLSSIKFNKTSINEESERWEHNVKIMNSLSESFGAKYFVFLQPTLGIYGQENYLNPGTRDFTLFNSLSEDYKENLNKTYKKLKAKCSQLEFCFDLTESIIPNGNMYSDERHLSENGNMIISNKIFDHLNSNIENN